MNESHRSDKEKHNESRNSNYSFNLHNSSRLSSDSFLSNLPGAVGNCHGQHKKKQKCRRSLSITPTSLQNEEVFKQSTNPGPIKNISHFSDLAHIVGIDLSLELTQHLITLIKLGVPSDDVYLFMRDCITIPKKQTVAT